MTRCVRFFGAVPRTLVWDREGAMHAGDGRPSPELAAFCGQLRCGWRILDPGDCEAKGVVEWAGPGLTETLKRGFRSSREELHLHATTEEVPR
jgi:hypothetical protein